MLLSILPGSCTLLGAMNYFHNKACFSLCSDGLGSLYGKLCFMLFPFFHHISSPFFCRNRFAWENYNSYQEDYPARVCLHTNSIYLKLVVKIYPISWTLNFLMVKTHPVCKHSNLLEMWLGITQWLPTHHILAALKYLDIKVGVVSKFEFERLFLTHCMMVLSSSTGVNASVPTLGGLHTSWLTMWHISPRIWCQRGYTMTLIAVKCSPRLYMNVHESTDRSTQAILKPGVGNHLAI